jgi:Cu2+-exporting ATPase
MVAVSVLIVTCPCALSLATPAAMLAAAGSLARSGVLVRRLQALDALAAVDTMVFDKTGTLTKDAFVLGKVVVRSGVSEGDALAMAAALARHSLHPVSRAIVVAQAGVVPALTEWSCPTATETPGQGVAGQLVGPTGENGSVVVDARLGKANFCGADVASLDALGVHLSDASGWVASFALVEDVRGEAVNVVQSLENAGVAVHLLSGDASDAVLRVAAQVGIKNVQGACSPAEKLSYMRTLQEQGHTVAMVGDGLNDGPVLAGAHVAFAFGLAVPLAQAKADFVVMGNDLMSVANTLLLARRTIKIVRQNLWWALGYNVACIPLAVMGYLPAWAAGLGMAASSLFVVLNALRLAREAKI